MVLYENDESRDIRVRLATITKREWQVLLLLAEGKSAGEIGEKLCLTTKSVHNSKNRIGKKLMKRGYMMLDRFAREKKEILFHWFRLFELKSFQERISIVFDRHVSSDRLNGFGSI